MQGFHTIFFFKKIQLEVGEICSINFFHPLGDHGVMEFLCMLSTKGIFVTAISPTSNWNFLNNFAYLEHLNNSIFLKKSDGIFFGLHEKFDGPDAKLNIKKQYF